MKQHPRRTLRPLLGDLVILMMKYRSEVELII